VAEVVGLVSEQEQVRIPKNVLEELEPVRRYTRIEVCRPQAPPGGRGRGG
jgi:hypothetical protein